MAGGIRSLMNLIVCVMIVSCDVFIPNEHFKNMFC